MSQQTVISFNSNSMLFSDNMIVIPKSNGKTVPIVGTYTAKFNTKFQ